MKTMLITGGAGFIGSNFVRHVLAKQSDIRIINLDKLTYAGNLDSLAEIITSPRHRFIKGCIGNRNLVLEILNKYEPDAVINFAAESHVDRSIEGPAAFIQTNIVGTFELLEAVRDYWQKRNSKRCTDFRFLQVSTDEVYGSLGMEGYFTETTAYAPNSPYSATKAASDHLVRAYYHTYGIPVLTTNCSNNYGPYQFPEKLIPVMILNALEDKQLPIYGDGRNVRDWLYVTDHCEAIWQVLSKGRSGEVYNVGGNNEKTNIEVVGTICRILDKINPRQDGASYLHQVEFVMDRPGHDRRYAIDSSKLQQETGWRPKETFETGLFKTICWYLDNSDWHNRVMDGSYQRERIGLIC